MGNLHLFLTDASASQKKVEISQTFCGLLIIYELYVMKKVEALISLIVCVEDVPRSKIPYENKPSLHPTQIVYFLLMFELFFQKLLKTSANPKSAKKKKKAAEKAVDAAPPTLIESEAAPALVEEE